MAGTEEYISPEAIKANDYEEVSYESDLWSLGVIFWQLFSSQSSTPFQGKSQIEIFDAVRKGVYEVPDLATEDIADLISKLLVRRPRDRIGSKNIDELKNHRIFANIDFNQIY